MTHALLGSSRRCQALNFMFMTPPLCSFLAHLMTLLKVGAGHHISSFQDCLAATCTAKPLPLQVSQHSSQYAAL